MITPADKKLAADMSKLITALNRRMGGRKNKGCDELHGACFDCKTRILIAYLNEWIEILL